MIDASWTTPAPRGTMTRLWERDGMVGRDDLEAQLDADDEGNDYVWRSVLEAVRD